jgi:hypothetical protein
MDTVPLSMGEVRERWQQVEGPRDVPDRKASHFVHLSLQEAGAFLDPSILRRW